ncbi:MAG: nucleotidyltransferase domain-containing protein [Candidatus Pacearchaeota archaeon]|nr:MAG: nucleotidyltransferase domain-containing protein [Candidatus Pacearchaeota archaeon]
MKQKCSLWRVFDVFVEKPLKIYYIKEIARKINLAPTSVKKHLLYLLKQNLILKKKGERFFGFVANRDNKDFLFYKKIFNIIRLKESGFLDFLIDSLHPQAIVLYGSYFRGEDIETSDIDMLILSKIKKRLILEKFERILKKGIHLITIASLKKLTPGLKMEVINGLVLHGYLKND